MSIPRMISRITIKYVFYLQHACGKRMVDHRVAIPKNAHAVAWRVHGCISLLEHATWLKFCLGVGIFDLAFQFCFIGGQQ